MLFTPTLADAVAKCVVFGALPAYGFYLLYLSVSQSLRSGKVWWYIVGTTTFRLYTRVDEPRKFWAAFCANVFMRFVICAAPLFLFAFIFLPRLLDLLRANHNGP